MEFRQFPSNCWHNTGTKFAYNILYFRFYPINIYISINNFLNFLNLLFIVLYVIAVCIFLFFVIYYVCIYFECII